jgi:hypothetical protein
MYVVCMCTLVPVDSRVMYTPLVLSSFNVTSIVFLWYGRRSYTFWSAHNVVCSLWKTKRRYYYAALLCIIL